MEWSLFGFQGLGQVFNVHPVFVHFPIALFPTALFFYLIGIVLNRKEFRLGGQVCLILGFIGTVFTVATGYWAQESFPHGEVIHRMMGTHETLGFIILGLGAVVMAWSFLRREGVLKAPKLFLIVVGATTLLILQNADLGARMVFVEGAAVKAVPMVAPSEEHHDHELSDPIPEQEKAPHDHHNHDHSH